MVSKMPCRKIAMVKSYSGLGKKERIGHPGEVG